VGQLRIRRLVQLSSRFEESVLHVQQPLECVSSDCLGIICFADTVKEGEQGLAQRAPDPSEEGNSLVYHDSIASNLLIAHLYSFVKEMPGLFRGVETKC
jgi:hypothetical protein